MLLELFIKAGWHTVPLKGKLERLDNGKKTLPIFEEDWRGIYTHKFNENVVPLAGAITGAKSGIIAIDCDNDLTYSLFKSLDPDYAFHFVSKGKATGGGTIIYKYSDRVSNFKLNTETLLLDFYADDGFVYLPTENNHTKESWEGVSELPPITECPPTILAMLETFKSKIAVQPKINAIRHTISNRIAPMLDTFIKNKVYDPVLFKVLTPYSFRDLPSYITKGHLHPNDVPKGRGSEYLSKVSAILGSDISVNVETYTNTMMIINSLWSSATRPWDKNRLMSTIINPMIEERASIDGVSIWQYDLHWEKMGFIATTLNGDYIESFYDDIKGLYYLVNYTIPYVRSFNDKRPVITTIKSLLGRAVTDQQYDGSKQLIRTMLNPSLEFGHVEGTDKYNLFRQTPELEILNNPGAYTTRYKRPTTTIKYFESLIPDDFMRAYVLSFIKTKLTTFKYSPVILYLIGKPGSGKDTLVSIIRSIIGTEYVAKPDTKVFLEHYNGWMIDKYLIQLDEYGNKLVRSSDKQEVLGKLKAYTGSTELQIRAMRTDGYNYKHSTTFIMTANSNPLPVETEDRRVAFIKTPNILSKEQWVVELGGVANVVEKLIPSEIQDFCYYLATEIKSLTSDNYVIAPETEDKQQLVFDGLGAAEQIIYFIQRNELTKLAKMANEYAINNFCCDWEKCRLIEDRLEDLYSTMTEGKGEFNTVKRMLKGIGISRQHTTKNGSNVFYYYITELHKQKPVIKQEYQGEVSASNSGIKGLT